jgi:hypothetical protein
MAMPLRDGNRTARLGAYPWVDGSLGSAGYIGWLGDYPRCNGEVGSRHCLPVRALRRAEV